MSDDLNAPIKRLYKLAAESAAVVLGTWMLSHRGSIRYKRNLYYAQENHAAAEGTWAPTRFGLAKTDVEPSTE